MSQVVMERPQSRSRSWWVPGLVFAVVVGLIAGLMGLQAPQATAQATVTITVKIGGDRTAYKNSSPDDITSVMGDNGGIAGVEGVTVAAVEGWSGSKNPLPSELRTSPYTAISDSNGVARLQVPASSNGYFVGVVDTPDTHYIIETLSTSGYAGDNPKETGYTMHTGNASSNVSIPKFDEPRQSNSEYAVAWDWGPNQEQKCNIFGFNCRWENVGPRPGTNSLERAQMQGSIIMPRQNPELNPTRCEAELNLVVMTDLSYSTRASGALPVRGESEYKEGLRELVDEMEDSRGVKLTLMSFAGDSPALGQPEAKTFDLENPSEVEALHDRIDGLRAVEDNGRMTQGTNWDKALWEMPTDADLALFVTDGMPTLDAGMDVGAGNADPDREQSTGQGVAKIRNIEMAAASANRLKANGVRVVAAGVGDAVTMDAVPNLRAISGPVEGRDYYRTGWSSLGATLAQSVGDSCTPDLSVTKTSDPAPGTLVEDGEEITYTVTAENTGEVDLDVLLSDDLSRVLNNAEYNNDHYAGAQTDGLVFYGGTSDSAPHLDWAGRLNVGERVVIVYSVTVDSAGQEVVLENWVTGTGNPSDGSPAITVGPISVDHHTEYSEPEIVPAPEYLIDKTSDPVSGTLVSENEEITYTITGVNDGNVGLNAELRDDLSEVLAHADLTSEPVASTGEVSFTGTDIYWTGSLAEGQAVEIVYTVTTHPGVGNVLINNVVNGEAIPIDPEHGTEPIIPEEVRTEHPTPELIENPENQLPNTGGAGVWALVIGGLIAAVIGGAIWLIWGRRD